MNEEFKFWNLADSAVAGKLGGQHRARHHPPMTPMLSSFSLSRATRVSMRRNTQLHAELPLSKDPTAFVYAFSFWL